LSFIQNSTKNNDSHGQSVLNTRSPFSGGSGILKISKINMLA